MTTSNLSPAQRIVVHEQKITDNIEQIDANKELIEVQETEFQELLAEKNELDNKELPLIKRLMRDDSLELERKAHNDTIEDAREKTSELKVDTTELIDETHSEKAKLKVAHADEKALHQKNVDDLQENKNNSEDRLNRLEEYDEQDPTKAAAQADKIEQEQAVLAKRENELAEGKESAEKAQDAAQARETKVADDIQESCPLKCEATQLAIKSNNDKRAFQLAAELKQSAQTLHVISLSQVAVNKKIGEPSIISVGITG